MRNVTLSADESVVEKARKRAAKEGTSLNAVFREWLRTYVAQESSAKGYRELMEELGSVSPGKRFSREELNER